MNRSIVKVMVRGGIGFVLCLAVFGCSPYCRNISPCSTNMEKYAEARYAQGLLYMEASRFELAQQQFAIVEKTSVSQELHQLAHAGYNKAAGVIEAKR